MGIKIIILLGPTGSGKTEIGVDLAQRINAEIISADSMSIYKRMDIGTAKPSLEDRKKIPHYFIDIIEPWETYNVGEFVKNASSVIRDIYNRNKKILIVGGTALYIKSLIEGIFEEPKKDQNIRNSLKKFSNEELYNKLKEVDPIITQKISCQDTKRIIRALEVYYATGIPMSQYQKKYTKVIDNYIPIYIGLNWKREILYERINKRVDSMIEKGLINEVQELLKLPYPLSYTASQAIGYKEVIEFLKDSELNKFKIEELKEKIKRNTRRFAKRQLTWFKRFPINWINIDEKDYNRNKIIKKIIEILKTENFI